MELYITFLDNKKHKGKRRQYLKYKIDSEQLY